MMDLDTGEFERPPPQPFLNARYLNFEVLEYPSNNIESTWHVSFNPNNVNLKKAEFSKTNVTISLTSPPTAEKAIQSGVLKLKIIDTWAFGNVYFAPDTADYDSIFAKLGWFFAATITMGFGKYSGSVLPEYHEVEVLVKVKPYHAVNLEALPLVNLKPYETTSIPISLENLGNYNDTFNFKVTSEHEDIIISDPVSITLAPGEKKETFLAVSAPPSIFDTGTIHTVDIEAYSVNQPNVTIAERSVILETKGLYISENNSAGLIFLIVILLFVAVLFYYRRKAFFEKHCIKPDKPWEIYDEKRYLEQLKQKDSEKYKETLDMMQNEYRSSLLWYNDYCKNSIKKELENKKAAKVKKQAKKTPKKIKEKVEEKPKEKPVVKEQLEKTKGPEAKIVQKKEITAIKTHDKNLEASMRKKQRSLDKIRREQNKQKRKIKGYT